jgi:hypothetical protein
MENKLKLALQGEALATRFTSSRLKNRRAHEFLEPDNAGAMGRAACGESSE